MIPACGVPAITYHCPMVPPRSQGLPNLKWQGAGRPCGTRQAKESRSGGSLQASRDCRSAWQRHDLPRLQSIYASLHPAAEDAFNHKQSVRSAILRALAAAVVLVQPAPTWAAEVIQGNPRVSDGDTIQIDDKKIRLFGFDAPEKAQHCTNAKGADYSCGLESGQALQNMIGSNAVRCEVRNKDQYGRNVSSCSVLTRQGPQDIGNYMVSNGFAVAYRQYGTDYVAAEDAAHQAHKGLWQGKFEIPADWRKDQKIQKLLAERGKSASDLPDQSLLAALAPKPLATSGPSNGCKIKGNINAKGDKIYHMPGSQYYEATQIDIPQGERWFCTEQQAKDAGWRGAQ